MYVSNKVWSTFFCSELTCISVHFIGKFGCFAALSVQCSLVVICWERAKLLALLYVMFFKFCVFVTFLCYGLGQVWYLIISIPDLCLLPYFVVSRRFRF